MYNLKTNFKSINQLINYNLKTSAMKKSFTQLISIFMLVSVFGFQALAVGPTWDGTKSVPVNGATNVNPADIATQFVVAFDQAPQISAAGGTFAIYKGGTLVKTIPIVQGSSDVTVSGKTLVVNHGLTGFSQGDVYQLVITNGAITDFGGIAQGNWSFTIGDYVSPKLSTTAANYTPANGAEDVEANLKGNAFSLTIPFNEAVVPATGNVYVYAADGTIIDIIDVTTLNQAATANVNVPIAATAIFKELTKYYVTIDANAFVDASPNANKFAGLAANVWTFTTRDNTAPAIETKTVSDITETSAKLNVSLSEAGKYYYLLQTAATADPANAAAVKAGGTAVTVSAASTVVTANLTVVGSTDYEVFVVAEDDAPAPTDLSAIEKLTFSSVDNTAPQSVSRGTIVNGDKKTTGVYMVFNEEVKGGTGTLDLRLQSDQSYVKKVDASTITSSKITTAADATKYGAAIDDYVVIVDFGMTLPSKVGYYVVFHSDYIKDMANNNFTGTGAFTVPINTADWPFTSSDFELPVVTFSAVNISGGKISNLSSNLYVNFDEAVSQVNAGAAVADLVALELDNVALPFTASWNGNTQIVIDPTANLESNKTYTVKLHPNTVEDGNNNVAAATIGYLTTGDLGALGVKYGSSEGDVVTAGLKANSTLQIKFSKKVRLTTTGTPTVTADNIKPYITFKKGATAKDFTVTYDAATFTVTITPAAALVSAANDYTLALDESKIEDVNGTDLGNAVVTTNYSVVDYLAPVATLSHSGNVENTPAHANPTITYNEDLYSLAGVAIPNGADVRGLVTFKANDASGANLDYTAIYNNKVITITPAVALATGSTYYYGIGASVQDAADNVAAAKYGTFTMVAPAVAPTIVAETYTVNGSDQTPVATKLVNIVPNNNTVTVTVTFNDNIKEVAASTNVTLTDGVTTWTTAVTSANVSGKVLTVAFNTGGPLASEALCTVALPAGLVQGSSYIAGTTTFAQFAGKNILFNSKDIVPPAIAATVPAAAATGIALDAAVKLTFSEKVELGSGNITVKEGANTELTIPINSTNVTLNAAGTEATINHADFIKYNTAYTVTIPKEGFKDDLSANNMAADYSWSFTTVGNPQPTVDTYFPADDADMVVPNTSITLTFDEAIAKNYTPGNNTLKGVYLVKKGDGTATLTGADYQFNKNGGTDSLVKSLYIDNSAVGISGKTVTIDFGVTLAANTEYFILIAPEAFKDLSTGTTSGANPIPGLSAGITAYGAWNFTTADTKPANITFSYTKRGDGKVAKTSDITITFSKPIVKVGGAEITNADVANLFTLTKTSGANQGVKAFVGEINAAKTVVTILNSSLVTLGEMTELSNYTIALNANAIKCKNNANVLGGSDNFTTSDYTAPAVAVSVANPIADVVDTTATVTFASTDNTVLSKVYYLIEAGDANTATPAVSVIKASGSKDITGAAQTVTNKFTGLTSETSYVVFAVAEDKAGNESAVSKVVFITDDVTKPQLADISALPTSFDANKQLTLTFNEDVVAPAVQCVKIINKATGITEDFLKLNAVAGHPTQLITDVFAGLATDVTEYYIEINGGVVHDVPVVAGDAVNTFDGLFQPTWVVTAKDVTAPTTLGISPDIPDPTIRVAVDASFVITFDEAMQKVSPMLANAFVIEEEKTPGSGTYDPFEVVDPANVTIDGANVTINPSRTFKSTTKYRMTILANTLEDLAGNDYAQPLQGSFTTEDIVAPTVTYNPANSATNVSVATAALTFTFDEPIRLLDNSKIDKYDLDTLVYFKKDGADMAFSANIDAARKVITVTPAAALVKDATYTYGFKAKFEDDANNAVGSGEATFNTELTPQVTQYVTFAPNNDIAATPTPATIDQTVTVTFTGAIFTHSAVAADNNLPVTPAYLASDVFSLTDNGVAIPAADLVFTIDADSKVVTITPAAAHYFASGDVVVVNLNGNKVQINEGPTATVLGTAGVVYATNDYKVNDVTAPILDVTADAGLWENGYYPEKMPITANASVIAKTDNLKLAFNEDVKIGTGDVEIRLWNGVLEKTIPSSALTVDATKRIVTLGDLTNLATNTEYYVVMPSGVITDIAGNAFAGITGIVGDAQNWRFVLQDDNIPQASYTPVTSNIPVTTNLTITFDRPVDLGTGYVAIYNAAGAAIQLLRTADNATTHAFTISADKLTATINIADLAVKTEYHVEVSAGTFVSHVDNSIKQSAISKANWIFTTESNDAPEIAANGYAPAKGDTLVGINDNVVITFNMDVAPGSGNIQLHTEDGAVAWNFDVTDTSKVVFSGNTVTVKVPTMLENTSYYVIVPGTAVKNTTYTPEYFAGITVPYVWEFRTVVDGYPPVVVSLTPNADSIADNHPTFVMTFNENVQLTNAGGSIHVTAVGETTAKLDIPITAAMISDSVVTINYVYDSLIGGLDKYTTYYVTVDADALQDAAGNKYAGISDPTAWTFTTGEWLTAVPKLTADAFRIYPTIIENNSKLTVEHANKLSHIFITNITGQRVSDIVNPREKITVNGLERGMYFITLIDKNGKVVKSGKIIKR